VITGFAFVLLNSPQDVMESYPFHHFHLLLKTIENCPRTPTNQQQRIKKHRVKKNKEKSEEEIQ
jgi:hypothetical protein